MVRHPKRTQWPRVDTTGGLSHAAQPECQSRRRTRCWAIGTVAAGLLAAVTSTAAAQIQFIENGKERGILAYQMTAGMGGGVAAADFDDDGDIDLFVPNAQGVPDQLYRNLGDGQFEEIALEAGLASLQRSRVALWFDYDGDHRLDLFVASDCFASQDQRCVDVMTLRLYRQVADAQFEDVTSQAGFTEDLVISPGQHRGGLCAADINNDGYLDLFTGLWAGQARVFLNNRDGSFADISLSCEIGGSTAGHWQPIAHDFDHDGWMDLFWAIDFTANHLWLNQRSSTFLDVAAQAGVDHDWTDMGVAMGDYDNDGDLDFFVSEFFDQPQHNLLYRNDSSGEDLAFTDVAIQAGVDNAAFAWGATFLDCDNDGWLDLAVTNGYFYEPWLSDQSRFFLNQGGDPVTFADVSADVGFDDVHWGSSLIAVDIDRDGDPDLVQTCNAGGRLRVLENQPVGEAANNHYLVIKPRMHGPNHRAIGATVRAMVADRTMLRLITAGTSFLGQEPAEAMFGLGTSDSVDSITVNWPDGTQTTLNNVAADQVLTVWHEDGVTPDSVDAFRGFLASGTLADVLESDDSDLCYEPGIVLDPTEAPVTLDFTGTLPNDSPASLDVTIESSANTVGLELTFSFWNYNTNSWDVVGTESQSLDVDMVRTFAGTPADHVEPGTGAVMTRYEVRQTGPVFLFPWADCVDQVVWTTTN